MNDHTEVKKVKGGLQIKLQSDAASNHSVVTNITHDGARKLIKQLQSLRNKRSYTVG